ncbi:MAG TPA: DUF2784 domain-containing protein [Rhodocyclaceae bacterium]|nr:DUF2784 domain-containing protein [Rhodocyclaceae bacterium]
MLSAALAIAADGVVVLHFAFVLFALLGGLLVPRFRALAWLHPPAALWAALIEFAGWSCPLTPLENQLRRSAGSRGYADGFIEHYLLPLIYPAGLTRELQIAFGFCVLAANLLVYGYLRHKLRRDRRRAGD